MPRPRNKTDLLAAAEQNYAKLLELISGMTEKELGTPFDFSGYSAKKEAHWSRDKNVRDVIMHLYEWQELMLKFISSNAQVQDKKGSIAFLPPEYSWKTYGAMNVMFWKRCQDVSQESALAKLAATHAQVLEYIKSYSDEELFTKGFFPWTGNVDLGSYFVSTTSSHYDWALKKLKAHRKNCRG